MTRQSRKQMLLILASTLVAIALVMTAQLSAAIDYPAGVVLDAYWSFDNSGDPYHDDSGNGHNGSALPSEDPSWQDGYLSFDAANDCVTFDNVIGNFGTSDFAVVFLMRTATEQGQTVMGKRVFCGVHSFWEMTMSEPAAPAGEMFVELYQEQDVKIDFPGNYYLADGDWHEVGIVREGLESRFYVDGDLYASDSFAELINIDNVAPFRLGDGPCVDVGNASHFSGELDEVRIYVVPEAGTQGEENTQGEEDTQGEEETQGCCGATGPVAPLGLAIGMLLLSRFAGHRSTSRRR